MAEARRMGKSELFSHFAERFDVKRTQSREFFDELAALCEKELKRSGEFVIPGMVKLVRAEAQRPHRPQSRHRRADQDPGQDRGQGADRQAAEGRGSAKKVALACSTPWIGRERTPALSLPIALISVQLNRLEPAASSRISSRSILNFSVHSGTPR